MTRNMKRGSSPVSLCLRCGKRPSQDGTFYCNRCLGAITYAKEPFDKKRLPDTRLNEVPKVDNDNLTSTEGKGRGKSNAQKEEESLETIKKHLKKTERVSRLIHTVTTPSRVYSKLRKIAQKERKTVQDVINDACEKYVENYEEENEP